MLISINSNLLNLALPALAAGRASSGAVALLVAAITTPVLLRLPVPVRRHAGR